MHVRHPWRAAAILAAVAIGALLLALASVVPFSSETARRKVIAALGERLDAEVELADLQLRLFPRFRAEGRGLKIHHKGWRGFPPMISIERFTAEGNIAGLLRRHIARAELERLDIEIPPGRARATAGSGGPERTSSTRVPPDDVARIFVIDELVSNDGQLVIIPGRADASPKVWRIHRLRMTSVSMDRAMPFAATLTNAVPPGEIETSGSFGPWRSEQPGDTPLDGTFAFDRADLGVFKGISGILSARGSFGGTLERIDIHGETNTPQFMIEVGGHPMPLHAGYHAIVDGTNGNTLLERVDAKFLDTALVVKGGVIDDTPGTDGRTVTLDVVMDRARLEDVLRMVVKAAQPPMVGALQLTTKVVLPPGKRDVVRKLRLDGRFAIADGRFASPDVQARINELSHRTRGRTPVENRERVSSRFAGTFTLSNGRLTIPDVAFDVPGSAIRLSGSYGLVDERLDFAGTAYTDAKISEMTTGVRSLLLKPVDLLFRTERGGSAVPIRITGTRAEPSFGVDKGRVFKHR